MKGTVAVEETARWQRRAVLLRRKRIQLVGDPLTTRHARARGPALIYKLPGFRGMFARCLHIADLFKHTEF